MVEKRDREAPLFDKDLSPYSHANQRAAEVRNLVYDSLKKAYVDADGCMVRDEYGQNF